MSHKPLKSSESWTIFQTSEMVSNKQQGLKVYIDYIGHLQPWMTFAEPCSFTHVPYDYISISGWQSYLIYLLQGWARRENKHWHRHVGNLMISIFAFMSRACWLCVLPLSGCVSPLSQYELLLLVSLLFPRIMLLVFETFLTGHNHCTATCLVAFSSV